MTATEQALDDQHCTQHRAAHEAAQRCRIADIDRAISDAPWFIAVSNTNCERRAIQGLEDRGFECWWPTRQVEVKNRYAKKVTTPTYPLFPGYPFTRKRTATDWQQMVGVDGLEAALCNHFEPVTIPHAGKHGMEALQAHRAPHAMPLVEDALSIGESIVITHGPFASFPAIVRALIGNAVEVSVTLFGRDTSISIGQRYVARV